MVTGGLAFAIMPALVLATPARGADQPIDAKLVLSGNSKTETLVFPSRDRDALFPASGVPTIPPSSA